MLKQRVNLHGLLKQNSRVAKEQPLCEYFYHLHHLVNVNKKYGNYLRRLLRFYDIWHK